MLRGDPGPREGAPGGPRARVGLAIAVLAGLAAACASLPGARPPEPLRISELVEQGDPARRASQRLLVEGLEADVDGAHARAKGRYERAIQVDPTNPYAYLVLARFEVERRRPAAARAFLDRTYALFDASGGVPRRVEPQLIGLDGAVEAIRGNHAEAARQLEQARRGAPAAWQDATLGPEELL